MDLTTILPLLMGGKNPDMATILSLMNQNNSGSCGAGKEEGKNGNMGEILAKMLSKNSADKGDKGDKDASPFAKMTGGGQAELLMSLMNSMNKPRPKSEGLSAIQRIAPNDILGVLLKYYNRKRFGA